MLYNIPTRNVLARSLQYFMSKQLKLKDMTHTDIIEAVNNGKIVRLIDGSESQRFKVVAHYVTTNLSTGSVRLLMHIGSLFGPSLLGI